MIYASQDVIWLLEDDIILETDCLAELWKAMQSDKLVGGVSSMITNQRYISPGRVSRLLFRSLHGRTEASYAGKCIGPALNLLPEDRDDLPTVVPVEWLNAGCTLYRREALPHPMFSDNFKGYSLMEDLALSLRVGQHWKLANARLARIYHDSQSADYKSNQAALAKMELINRHYVMTKVLGRNHVGYYLKLAFLEAFGVITPLTSLRAWAALPSVLLGKIKGVSALLFSKNTL
jgi:GT2 family glycosyltransferase